MDRKLIPGLDYIGISVTFYCTDGKRFLFHKRSENCRDEQGKWDVGGGQLAFGETPEEGVLREVKEEYGCDGEILGRIPAITVLREQDGKTVHWLALPFIIRVDPKDVKNNEPHKITEIRWFTLDNLPSPLHSVLEKHIFNHERGEYLRQYIC